jgi:hypothetical protein
VRAGLRGVARREHPVHGPQEPLLALGPRGAEPGGGHHGHGRRFHALPGRLAIRLALEPLRQLGVGPGRRRREMPERRALVLHQLGGEGVQVGAPARADLVVDGGRDERVGEGGCRDRRRVDPAEEAGVARLLERVERLLDAAQRSGDRERRAGAEDRHRLEQARGVVGARLDAPADDRRERARRREVVLPMPRLRRQLVEQRARVQRVAARVRLEPLDRPRGEAEALSVGERPQLLRGQRLEPQPAPLGPGGGLDETLRETRRVLPGRRHDQHAVGDEASDDEQQGAQRGHVGPVGVVEEQHDGVLALQRAEQLEDPSARRQVIRLPRRRLAGAAEELVDDPEGQLALRQVAAGPEDGHVARAGEEVLDERRLADAGGPFDEHQPRLAGACALQSLLQRLELPLPADEDRAGARRLQLPLRGHPRVGLYPAPS